jgi:uncharacterized membrane protein YbaN (DUF454 family)
MSSYTSTSLAILVCLWIVVGIACYVIPEPLVRIVILIIAVIGTALFIADVVVNKRRK